MLRNAAIIANVGLLIAMVLLFSENGMPREEEILLVLGLLIAPCLSLAALLRRIDGVASDDNLIALWVRKKKLEQKAQIKALDES